MLEGGMNAAFADPKVCRKGHPHRPYASMNWIRFIGSLRGLAAQQHLSSLPEPPW